MTPREPLVRNFMSHQPMTIESNKSARDARELMTRFGIHHLPVVTDGIVVGMLSEREVYLAAEMESADGGSIRAIDACSGKPFIVDPETSVREVAGIMAARHIGSAVVMKGGCLVGIFTSVDACRALHHLIEDVLALITSKDLHDFRFVPRETAMAGIPK